MLKKQTEQLVVKYDPKSEVAKEIMKGKNIINEEIENN